MKTRLLHIKLLCLSLLILGSINTTYAQESLAWIRTVSGPAAEPIIDIAAGSGGVVYATGWSQGAVDFDGPGSTGQGGEATTVAAHMYLAKYDEDGNFLWVVMPGHDNLDEHCSEGSGVAVASDNSVYVTGSTRCTIDFDGPTITGNGGEFKPQDHDVYLAKYDASGSFLWVYTATGINNDFSADLALADNGNVYITGFFEQQLTFGGLTLYSGGADHPLWDRDVFIAKFSPAGNLTWVLSATGYNTNQSAGIAIGSDESVHVTGTFTDNFDFDGPGITGQGGEFWEGNLWSDMFLAKYDANGNFLWARDATIPDHSITSSDVEVGSNNDPFITGYFSGIQDLDGPRITGQGGEISSVASSDIFIARYRADGTLAWVSTAGGKDVDRGRGITLTALDNVFITGSFTGEADFDGAAISGAGGEVIGKDLSEFFLAKYASDGALIWVKPGTGPSYDNGWQVTRDPAGNTLVTGQFTSSMTLEQSTVFTQGSDYPDFFIAQFRPPTIGPVGEINPIVIYEAEVHVFVHPEDIVTTIIDSHGEKMSIEEVYFTAVTSDEPATGKGDKTTDDIIVKSCQIIGIRPELGYNSNGRVYTLHMAVTDKYGVSGAWEAEVHVLSKGMKEAVKDEAAHKVEACSSSQKSIMKSGKLKMDDWVETYPNPFNPQTTVTLSVAERQDVVVQVFDLLGRRVATLYRGELEAHRSHLFTFDASALPSGVYLIRAQGERFVQTRRVMLAK